MNDILHIDLKSEYNFDSLIKVEQLIEYCKAKNIPYVAVSDQTTLHHMVDFIELAQKNNIKPIIACEFEVESFPGVSVTLFAKNNTGMKRIVQLSSMCHSKTTGRKKLKQEHFLKEKENLVFVVELLDIEKDNVSIQRFLRYLKTNTSNGDLYLKFTKGDERYDSKSIRVKEVGEKEDIKLIASNPVRYLKKEHKLIKDILVSIHRGNKHSNSVVDESFKSEKEMLAIYRDNLKAIEHTKELAKKCHISLSLKGDKGFKKRDPIYKLPKDYRLPESMKGKFELLPGFKKPESKEKALSIAFLCELAEKGFKKHYKDDDIEAKKRLKYELGLIITRGFDNYFLIVNGFIQYAKQNKIPLGPGRGSAAGSILARCLGVTKVCPVTSDLQFERFLNPERQDDPDVDIDVSQEKHFELIKYAKEKYGSDKVSQIASFKFFGLNDAIRASGKVLGVESKLVEKIIESIQGHASSVKELLQNIENSETKKRINTSDQLKTMILSGIVLQNITQSISKHAAGLILSEKTIMSEVPVMATKDNDTGETILMTQIANNKQQLEKLGYTKIDLLRNRNVDLIDKTIKLSKSEKKSFSYNDDSVFDLYRKGQLTGVFQMDSTGMQKASKLIKPGSIDEIAVLLALFRPGPMKQIKLFAQKKEKNDYDIYDQRGKRMENVDDLKGILKNTYGIIVFQEQINKIVQKWAGYSLGEADLLRRAISKKKVAYLKEEAINFLKKAREMGRDDETTKQLYHLIMEFAQYGFNRSHAYVYALLSYQTAWFKVHHPKEYMSILISSIITKDAKKGGSYVDEARRMGLKIAKPDVNASTTDFVLDGDEMIFGMSLIKNVGKLSSDEIIKERRKGLFTSFPNFLNRCIGKEVKNEAVESMIYSGCFDEFGERKQLLKRLKSSKKTTLNGFYTFDDIPGIRNGEEDQFSFEEKLQKEYEYIKTYMSYQLPINYKKLINQLIKNGIKQKDENWLYGIVKEKRVINSYNKKMMYVTIQKNDSFYEIVFHDHELKRITFDIKKHHLYLFKVKIGKEKTVGTDIQKISGRNLLVIDLPTSLLKNSNLFKQIQAEIVKQKGNDDCLIKLGDQSKKRFGKVDVENRAFQESLIKMDSDIKIRTITF